MIKVKLTKIRRETYEALVVYLSAAKAWTETTDKSMESKYTIRIAGAILYKLRVRINNKLAAQPDLHSFQHTFEFEEAIALLLYFELVPISGSKLDQIMLSDFMGKIDKQIQ